MTYLSSFEHDIFISYAHVDNLTPNPGEKGWIDQFQVVMENKCIILFCHQLFVQNVNQFKYQRVTLLMRFSTISNSVSYLWRYLSEFIKKTMIFSKFCKNIDKYS